MKHWYVIYTKPKAEYKVAAWLSQYEIETYVPDFHSLSAAPQISNKEILFPCYVFVKISLEKEGLSSIQWVPGVRSIVSFGGKLATIPDYVMNEMQQNIQLFSEAKKKHTRNVIKSGTPVRIISGPFQSMQAIFERPTSSDERVQILLEVLGSLNRVNIDVNDLEVISDKQTSNSSSTYKKRPRRTRGRGRRIKVKE